MRDRSHENGLVLGLVVNCLVRSSVSYCPLSHLETLSLDEQIVNIEQLSNAEIDAIVMHHHECLETNSKMIGI